MEKKEITENKNNDKKLKTAIIVLAAILITTIIILVINITSGSSSSAGGMPGGMGGAPSGMQSGQNAGAGAAGGNARAGGQGVPNGGTPGQGSAEGSAPSGSAPVAAATTTRRTSSSSYSVNTQIAKKETITDFVTASGDVETQSSIEVFPSIGGKIVEMNISLGSHVNEGDVIARVDPSEPGSYYSLSPILAPISGSILSSPLKINSKVSTSSVITTIGDIDNLQITVKIPERYVSDLAIGQKADISLEAYPGIKFSASVVRISPVLDSASRTKEVILNFTKKDSRINAGMFAKIKLWTRDYSGKIVVPQDAIVTNNDDKYVFIVKNDNTVEKRAVTTGKNIDGVIQIESGVSEDEVIVVEGMLQLYDGATVNILNK